MKESNQDQKIISWIKDRYGSACRTEKRHADRFSEVGLPDLNIVVYGMSIQIEDKVKGEFPRDNQLGRLLEYKDAGAISFWCDTFEMFLEKWETLVENNPRFILMKNKWEKPSQENKALRLLDYKKEQENNRSEWMERYKNGK